MKRYIIVVILLFIGQNSILAQDNKRNSKAITRADSIEIYTLRAMHYLYKQIYQWNAPLSYVAPPLTDVTLGRGATHRTYWVSADINPNIFILMEEKRFFALNIQPRYVVRGLWTHAYSPRYGKHLDWKSMPVRTPSYLPMITAYFTFKCFTKNSFPKFLNQNVTSTRKVDKSFKELKYTYISASIFHNSNGQDSSNVSPELRKKYERVMNIQNGNFAVDLSGNLGVHFGKFQQGRPDYRVMYWKNKKLQKGYFSADVLWQHYIGVQTMLINSIDNEMKGSYGHTRINYRFQRMARTYWHYKNEDEYVKYERDRLILDISFMTNRLDNKPLYHGVNVLDRFNIDLKYHFPIRWFRSGTSGLFIGAGYRGQDPYNVYFEDKYPYVQLGLSLGNRFYINERDSKNYDRIKKTVFEPSMN
jgi:hypothetical protein